MMDIMLACIILHNTVIEDELGQALKPLVNPLVGMEVKYGLTFEILMEGTEEIENLNSHFRLHNDLIEYLWVEKGKFPLY
jgi:hypothetical protein